jgi:hypothetical protein
MEIIMLNNVEYVRRDQVPTSAVDENKLKAVIVRTYSAGVFYGYLESQVGQEVVLKNARRMWQWFGASLSECAQSGTPDTSKCKFPEAVTTVTLLNAIEILDLTPKALSSLNSVAIWKA